MIRRILNARILAPSGQTRIANLTISRGKIRSVRRNFNGKIIEQSDFDARGRLLLPAFIDCHCHLFSLAESFEDVKLSGSKSIHEMLNRIRIYQLKSPKWSETCWIFGRGWDQDNFKEKRLPTRNDLDQVVKDVPAIMTRVCGHIAVMNSKALEFFASRGALRSYNNELVPKDKQGKELGIVKETALDSCWAALPHHSIGELRSLFLRSQAEALYYGLVGAHCILDSVDQLEAITRLDDEGQLELKLGILLPISSLNQIENLKQDQRNKLVKGKRFRVLGFKVFADGSLGARTAALNEDYSDQPGNRGILNYSDEHVVDFAKRVKELHLILATHAIGDMAVEQTLRAYKKAGIKRRDGFRIEHCSIVRPQILNEKCCAILSIQPMFASSDYWLKERIGSSKSRRVGYPFKTLSKLNYLVGGSDAPVESLDPLTGIRAATNNKADRNESLSLADAIQIYTVNAAKLSPLTMPSGSIKNGSACDLVVLDTESVESIATARVENLFIDGRKIDRRRSELGVEK
jgi:predicted amidohydrolase YtcJ